MSLKNKPWWHWVVRGHRVTKWTTGGITDPNIEPMRFGELLSIYCHTCKRHLYMSESFRKRREAEARWAKEAQEFYEFIDKTPGLYYVGRRY